MFLWFARLFLQADPQANTAIIQAVDQLETNGATAFSEFALVAQRAGEELVATAKVWRSPLSVWQRAKYGTSLCLAFPAHLAFPANVRSEEQNIAIYVSLMV